MRKELIVEAFKKAKEERLKNNESKPSLIQQAEDISNYVKEKTGFSLGERQYRNYLQEAEELKNSNRDIHIQQIKVIRGLCEYTGNKNKTCKDIKPPIPPYYKIIALIIILGTITVTTSDFINKSNERWMTWQKDRYVEVKFDLFKYYKDELETYDEKKLKTFKQILEPDCDTEYRNAKGDWVLWYYKRGKNDLDIFTAPGTHPINGKALKRITKYMIREHICEDY